MENQIQKVVIRPEPHVFANYTNEKFDSSVEYNAESKSVHKMVAQGARVYLTERVIYPETGGILMKYKDVPYLRQGFVFPEAMDSVNNLKRISVLFLAILKGKGIKGKIENFLAHYCWLANWVFNFYNPSMQKVTSIFLKENRYRQSIQQLIKLINNFLLYLNIHVYTPETGNQDFGRVIGTMIEYDNAYHWRMEDVLSETSKELLIQNPRKELKRLLEIYKSREKANIEFKAETIVKYFNYLLLIPSVKKAFRKAIESVDIEQMKMKKNDSYFTMNYEGYDFQGKPIKERQKKWLAMTDGIPPERMFIPAQN